MEEELTREQSQGSWKLTLQAEEGPRGTNTVTLPQQILYGTRPSTPNPKAESEFGATKFRNSLALETRKLPRTDWPSVQLTRGFACVHSDVYFCFFTARHPGPFLYLNKTYSLTLTLTRAGMLSCTRQEPSGPGLCRCRASPWLRVSSWEQCNHI